MGLVIEAMPELGVTRISRWVFNCYVIHNNGDAIVVDAGLPTAAADVAPVLDRLSGRVRAIVATHGHSDHVAGAAGVAAQYEAPIHLPAVTMKYLEGQRPRTPSAARVARIWPTLIDQPPDRIGVAGLLSGARSAGYGTAAGMRWSGPAPAGALADAKPLPGAPEWLILATPGHTDDSVAFWNPLSRTLIAGDAVLSARGRVWHTPETVDDAAARRTRERLEKLPVAHLLPGHGRTVHAGTTVWDGQRR
ncbi:MBL fold metallo-hydrolase [Mycobacterium seoulense]|uniref:MBL fold metallo-hydrolase n=1 Tax=Mycobacterium seoulense TaxID=386911 RepID=UPI003CEF7528